MKFSVPNMQRSAEIADNTVRLSVLTLAALLPFFFIPVSWVSASQAKMLLVASVVFVATLAWAWGRFVRRSFTHPGSLFTYAALSLPLVYTVSAIVSGRDAASFAGGTGEQDTVVVMFILFALFFLSATAFRAIDDATKSFVRALTAGGLVLVVIQALHLLIPALTFGVLSASAPSIFGSWHDLGVIAGLFVFLSLTLTEAPFFETYWKWALLILGVLSAVLLVIVNMADVLYVFGVLAIAFGVYRWRVGAHDVRHLFISSRREIAMVVIGVIALVCGFGTGFIHNHMPTRLQVSQSDVYPSWRSTLEVGQKVFTGAGAVVFGSGPNTFTREWSLYKPLGANATVFWNSDFSDGAGFIPTTFVTVGLLGVFAWLSLAIVLLWSIIRFVRSKRNSPMSSVHEVLLAAALYLTVIHVVSVPAIGLSALMFMLLGLVALIGSETPLPSVALHTDTPWNISRTLACALLAVAVVVASLFAVRATLSDVLVNRSAAVYRQTGSIQHSLNLVEDALTLYPGNDRAHRAAVELGVLQLQRLLAQDDTGGASVAALQETVSSTIQHGLAAVKIDGADYQNWLSLATLYQSLAGAGVKGGYDNAKTALTRAHEGNPNNPQPLLQLAQIGVAENNTTEALEYLRQAISLKPDFAAAYFLRSQIEMGTADYVHATADASTAAELSPNDAPTWYNLGVTYYAVGNFDAAVQSLMRAVGLQNDYANALFVLGLSYEKLGRHQDAIGVLQRVSQLNPADTTLLLMIENIQSGLPVSAPKKAL